MNIYKLYKEDHTDKQWYDMIRYIEKYPEYCDMFDRNGEIAEDYEESFNTNLYGISHDSIRIDDFDLLLKFLQDNSLFKSHMGIDILRFVNEYSSKNWEFKGDGDGLGWIIDIWDEKYEDCIETRTICFEDYNEYFDGGY